MTRADDVQMALTRDVLAKSSFERQSAVSAFPLIVHNLAVVMREALNIMDTACHTPETMRAYEFLVNQYEKEILACFRQMFGRDLFEKTDDDEH